MQPRSSHLFRNLVLFARSLRGLGIAVDANQIRALVGALEHVPIERREDVRTAARTVLVTRREHLALFDRAFDLFWTSEREDRKAADASELRQLATRAERKPTPAPSARSSAAQSRTVRDRLAPDSVGDEPSSDQTGGAPPGFSATERLRRRDFARLSEEERRRIEALVARYPWRLPRRRARRREPGRGPYLDLRRTWRRSLRHGGGPVELVWQSRKRKPRPLVVLCDVSGSMKAYSRLVLQFVHALGRSDGAPGPRPRSRGSVEAFAFGTRLTRITRALEARDVDDALDLVAETVLDLDGGTRIGQALKAFNYDWGRRVLRRGAIVLMITDGWDRGDVELLDREADRLHRSCHRLAWLNPLLGSPDYRPLTRGSRALLPHVDDFLPIHDLHSLEQLDAALARLGDRRGEWPRSRDRLRREQLPI